MCGHNSVVTFASKRRLFRGDADGTLLGDTMNFIRTFEGTDVLDAMFAKANIRGGSVESRLALSNQIK
jgi:hypothetical protein